MSVRRKQKRERIGRIKEIKKLDRIGRIIPLDVLKKLYQRWLSGSK